MDPNSKCDILRICQEEGSTQTDDVSARRFTLEEINIYTCSELEMVKPSGGVLEASKNSLIRFFRRGLNNLMLRKKVNKSTQTFVNPVVSTGEKLAREVVFYFIQEELYLVQNCQLSLCLREVVSEMLQKHDLVFTRMVNCLRITPATAKVAFSEVANHLFTSGGVTWGRIVALYAFACRLAVYCKERNMERLSRSIPLFMTEFIEENVAPFVEKHGGWDQLCAEFPAEEYVNDKIWKCLLMTTVVMGIVAIGYSSTKIQPH